MLDFALSLTTWLAWLFRGRSSVAERCSDVAEVAGSFPAVPTIFQDDIDWDQDAKGIIMQMPVVVEAFAAGTYCSTSGAGEAVRIYVEGVAYQVEGIDPVIPDTGTVCGAVVFPCAPPGVSLMRQPVVLV